MKKLITTTHFRRPEYSAATTRALAEQPDAKEWHYNASIEDGPDLLDVGEAIRPYLDAFASARIVVRVGQVPSCNDNIKSALRYAQDFDADFTVLVEDDVQLGKDALSWVLGQAKDYKNEPDAFTVSFWRHPRGWLPESGIAKPEGEDQRSGVNPWFVPWGWGTWRDRLDEILDNWTTGSDTFPIAEGRVMGSWDEHLNHVVRGSRFEVQPMISRAINIGKEKGTHRGDVPLSYWINS